MTSNSEYGAGDSNNCGTFPSMNEICTRIESLNFLSTRQSDFDSIALNLAQTSNEESADLLVESIFNAVLVNWMLSEQAVSLCKAIISTQSVFGELFQKKMLSKLESAHKASMQCRNKPFAFASIALLCQFYAKIQIPNDLDRYNFLSGPILDSLTIVTDHSASIDEIMLAARQLMFVGPVLEGDRRMTDIIRALENKIIDAKGSEDCRRKLIKLVKAKASNWELNEEILKKW